MCVPSEDSNQPAHLRSLIRIFAWHSMVSKGSKRLQADDEDSDQPAWRMRRLIWVFAGRICNIAGNVMPAILNMGIKHGYPWINIRQFPREVMKTEAGGCGFQHLPRDLANVNALKNHVRPLYYCIKTENICYIARYFLHYFVSSFHRCLANASSTEYARSTAGQYTSRNSSKSVASVRTCWKLLLTARELPC